MSAARRRRILWAALAGMALLLALLVAALGVLLYHPAGPRWAIDWLRSNTPLVIEVDHRAGALGAIARRLANAEVNIELFYVAASNRLVFGVDDLDEARSAL